MSVALDPARGEIQVSDRLSFRSPVSQLEFTLNAGLTPSVSTGYVEPSGRSRDGLRTTYRVRLTLWQDGTAVAQADDAFADRIEEGRGVGCLIEPVEIENLE